MSFAAIQARANASIFRLLATDDAELDSMPVKGKFSRATGDVLGGIGTRFPTFGLPSEAAAEASQESVLTCGSESFYVKSIEPDGAGWTVLHLQAVL